MTSWRKSVIGETKNTAQLQGDKKLEIKTLPKEAARKSVSSHFEAISLCLNELVIHSVLLLPLRNIPSGTLRKTSTSPRLKISFEGTKTRWRKFTQHGWTASRAGVRNSSRGQRFDSASAEKGNEFLEMQNLASCWADRFCRHSASTLFVFTSWKNLRLRILLGLHNFFTVKLLRHFLLGHSIEKNPYFHTT